jgi:hypothetical protein
MVSIRVSCLTACRCCSNPAHKPARSKPAAAAATRGGLRLTRFGDCPNDYSKAAPRLLIDWVIDYMAGDPSAISHADREIYARAYDSVDAIRASNA